MAVFYKFQTPQARDVLVNLDLIESIRSAGDTDNTVLFFQHETMERRVVVSMPFSEVLKVLPRALRA